MEDDLLAITGLGATQQDGDEREQIQVQLAALDGDDPRALLAALGA